MELNKIYLGDAYELIKQVPSKSVDLIYTDIPYLIKGCGGTGNNPSSLGTRINAKNSELGSKMCFESLEKQEKILREKMEQATTKEEFEKWHCQHGNILNKINLTKADIINGIDYSILDECCRVLKHIYIYMV